MRANVLLLVLLLSGCARSPEPPPPPARPTAALRGTSWRLVEFQSSDDAIGVIRPADPSRFTMSLGTDGSVSLQLDCNRANGTWTATPGSDSGGFLFGPLAMTRAACPPPNLDEQIARQAEYIRSFVLRDGRLYFNLMADGGTYVWEPSGG